MLPFYRGHVDGGGTEHLSVGGRNKNYILLFGTDMEMKSSKIKLLMVIFSFSEKKFWRIKYPKKCLITGSRRFQGEPNK